MTINFQVHKSILLCIIVMFTRLCAVVDVLMGCPYIMMKPRFVFLSFSSVLISLYSDIKDMIHSKTLQSKVTSERQEACRVMVLRITD